MELGLLLLFSSCLGSIVNCHRYPNIPGAPHNVSTDDSGVVQAALHGTYSFNNQNNDAFLFKPSAIEKAQRQIVKGLNYIMEVDLSRTVCHKNGHNTDLSRCVFQPDGLLKQTVHCNFTVWTIPWLDFMKTIYFACRPSEKNVTYL
ncbi:hypothetical protein DPEC_G00038660 [Dallia pectoralis]|uniref:Uncharacterized protein n=1 Tax=Dallia pectoralis TaxID=75939 RepID=A0ACC2HEA5_DALPE|nr:hypothetical protein DPEC_G00038660 [Dallia pectoralis]